jgi:hypothetical protein
MNNACAYLNVAEVLRVELLHDERRVLLRLLLELGQLVGGGAQHDQLRVAGGEERGQAKTTSWISGEHVGNGNKPRQFTTVTVINYLNESSKRHCTTRMSGLVIRAGCPQEEGSNAARTVECSCFLVGVAAGLKTEMHHAHEER